MERENKLISSRLKDGIPVYFNVLAMLAVVALGLLVLAVSTYLISSIVTIILVDYIAATGFLTSLTATLFFFIAYEIPGATRNPRSRLFLSLLLGIVVLVFLGATAYRVVAAKEMTILQRLSREGMSIVGVLFSAYLTIVAGLALETYKIGQWDELKRFLVVTGALMLAISLISLRVFGNILAISLFNTVLNTIRLIAIIPLLLLIAFLVYSVVKPRLPDWLKDPP